MPAFSFTEYTDMLMIYGQADGNGVEAKRLYEERFPDRRIPSRDTFRSLVQRMRETGKCNVENINSGASRSVRTVQMEEEILDMVAEKPNTSVRAIANAQNVSRMSVWRILKDENLYPYHLQKVQALGPDDFVPRVTFCRWYLQNCDDEPGFPRNLLFTDEATFSREGTWNQHNYHTWSEINPHGIRSASFQQKFRINVWAGFLNGDIIGPYILPDTLRGEDYLTFLQEVLSDLLPEDMRDNRENMWYQHDGAPAHFSIDVREHLNITFGRKWIGRGGPVAWSPRSPDLSPLDFFVWGHMKSLIYDTPIDSEEDLMARIMLAAEIIHRRDNSTVYDSMRERCNKCINMGGRQFEQLLH